MIRFVAAALGGAAIAVIVMAVLLTKGYFVPPHEHPDKRDVQAETAFEYVSKHDVRLHDIDAKLAEITATLVNNDLTVEPARRGTIGRWWCAVHCKRTKAACDQTDDGHLGCKPTRIAFCGSGRCFADYGMCGLMGYPDQPCIGVE